MRLWIGLVLLLAACGAAPSPSVSGHVVGGTFELVGGDNFDKASDGTCAGNGGYDDIVEGLGVTATNQAGDIIGSSQLQAGLSQGTAYASRKCVFAFTFGRLPDAEFYTFEAGSRGGLTYSQTELESKNWRLAFTIGS